MAGSGRRPIGIVDSLAGVSEPAPRRFGRPTARQHKLPSERDWERSLLLEPRPSPRHPALISDGGGLPFPPSALVGPAAPLELEDPAVAALSMYLADPTGVQRVAPTAANLDGWRLLARTDDEALFARGRPPHLLTVAVRQDRRRRAWGPFGSSASQPLRATRDGIRASSWRVDPAQDARPEDTVLRVLVTEQTFASGQRADRRVLAPDIYLDANDLVLTLFVTPRPGYQTGGRNPETPVRITLAEPVGSRQLIDGAIVGTVLGSAD
jgi:hypothetical protein